MASRKTITLSFSEYDIDIYNFLKSQSNASAYIRRLVLAQMSTATMPVPTTKTEEVSAPSVTLPPLLETAITKDNKLLNEIDSINITVVQPAPSEQSSPNIESSPVTKPSSNTDVLKTAPNISVSDDFAGLDIDDL